MQQHPPQRQHQQHRGEAAVAALVDRVREDILFGRLLPRERLVEDDLIGRLGATRHAVRTALQALARDGLVMHVPNRGAQVRDFSADEVEEITAMREWLHAEAARRLRLPAPAPLLRRLEALQNAHAEAVAAGDVSRIHRENEAFHATLFGACGNRYLAASIEQHARLSLPFRCHALADPVLAARARDEHAAMLDAIRECDRDALVRLCVGHTSFAKRTYRQLQGWPEVA